MSPSGWQDLPDERKSLRANVEATAGEMKGAMKGGKLPVRGGFAAHCHGLLRAIGVNLGRIARYMADPDTDGSLIGLCRAMGEQFQAICKKLLPFYPVVAARNLWARNFSQIPDTPFL